MGGVFNIGRRDYDLTYTHIVHIMSCTADIKIVATLQMHIYIDIYIYMYIYTYICIYIPAPGLPRVCFGIFLRVFMMTFMFISWYLQDF